MKKRDYLLVLLFFVLAVFTPVACGKVGEGGNTVTNPTNTPMPTEAAPTPSAAIYLDQLDIKGIQCYSSETGSLSHMLSVGYEIQYEGKSIYEVRTHTDRQGNIAFVYSEQGSTDRDGNEDTTEHTILFTSLDGSRLRVEKKISLGELLYCYADDKGDRLYVNTFLPGEDGVNHHYLHIFDYSGQECYGGHLAEINASASIYYSGDPDYYYEADTEAHTISKVNFVTGEKKEIPYSQKLYLENISGVTTIKDTDYICGSFLGGDLKEYYCIINADTSECLYIREQNESGYISCESDHLIINSPYDADYAGDRQIFTGDYLLELSSGGDYYSSNKLLGGRFFVCHNTYETHEEHFTFEDGDSYDYDVTDRTVFDIELLDYSDGRVIASNRLALDDEKDLADVTSVSDGLLMLTFTNQAEAQEIYLWTPEEVQTPHPDFSEYVKLSYQPFTGFDNPTVEGIYTREDFIPGTCSDRFKELREYADLLEKKYDITIHIAEEARCIMSGYVFEMLEDLDTTRQALEVMDIEFAKYPAGFFSLYKKLSNYPDGLELYFTGGLLGYEDGNLDRAGGLRTEDGDSINIAFDAFDGRYEAAVHHELSHSIEVLIEHLCSENLDADTWDAINNKYGGNRVYYAYSYMYQDSSWQYGFSKNYKYTYLSFKWKNKKQVLFYDDYAMTYPTEDRSRLFEQVMWDHFDISVYPALYDKFAYYTGLIRKMLVENGFEEDAPCYWEWVLKK